MAIRVGINGFGRIGRLVFRAGVRQGGIEFVAVNDLVPADGLAYLLQFDTTHGRFEKEVKAGDGHFKCCGTKTITLSVRDPAELPWGELGVDYVIESTGLFTDIEGAGKHLTAGAKRVLSRRRRSPPSRYRPLPTRSTMTSTTPTRTPSSPMPPARRTAWPRWRKSSTTSSASSRGSCPPSTR